MRLRTLTCLVLLCAALTLAANRALAEETASPQRKYLFQAAFTPDGIKNLQKQTASGFKAGVAKFFASVGGKLESWYFDYGTNTAYGFVDYPSEIAAASAQASVNAAGFAHVTYRSVLSAEDVDKALATSVSSRPPQQQ
jgi:uncharacterized protein with GYD domain